MGYVYFIRKGSEDIFKIGIATNPEWRIKALSTGSEVPLFFCATIGDRRVKEQEGWLHEQLAHRRINLEWFAVTWEEIKYYLDRWYAPENVTIYERDVAMSAEYTRNEEADRAALLSQYEYIEELKLEIARLESVSSLHRWENRRLKIEVASLVNALNSHALPVPPDIVMPDAETLALVARYTGTGTKPAIIAMEAMSKPAQKDGA
jgi:hypothetical protein